MPDKVAFIGKIFSGKSTAANVLVKDHGFIKLAFADPVKIVSSQMLSQLNSYLSVYDLPSQEWSYDIIQARKTEPQVRKLLQLVGTELGRELYDEDVWVNILLKSAQHLDKVVVDDCRFPNEADALRGAGFKIVRVERLEGDRRKLLQTQYPDTWQDIMSHPSETSLDDFEADHEIHARDVDGLVARVVEYIQLEN